MITYIAILTTAVYVLYTILREKTAAGRIRNSKTGKPVPSMSSFALYYSFFESLITGISTREMWIKNHTTLPSTLAFPYFGQLALILSNPEDIKKCQNHKDFDKDVGIRSPHFEKSLGHSLLNSNGTSGWQHRKSLNPAFKIQQIKTFIPIFTKCAEKLAKIWEGKSGKSINVIPDLKDLAFDIIGLAGFSYDFKSLSRLEDKTNNNDEENSEKKMFEFILTQTFSQATMTFGNWYDRIPSSRNKRFHESLKKCHKVVLDVIESRNKESQERGSEKKREARDLLDLILCSDDDIKLTPRQIIDDIFLFFLAGHETTSTTLTSIMYFLGSHPSVQEKAYKEISEVLGNSGEISESNIQEFRYIRGIIKETLRLFPPIFIVGQRIAVNDTYLGDYNIPKGTILLLNCIPAHYDENTWERPTEFRPDRFLNDVEDSLPIFSFAGGPRICIGNKFAMAEMTTTLITLIKHFTWVLPEGFSWKCETFTVMPVPKGGILPVILKQR